jgi:Fe2+ transport system protein FeoA
MRTLDQLAPGQRGIVHSLLGDSMMHQRIQEMGVIEGSEVEVVRLAPLGDPIEISVCGYFLSLRKSEAALIKIDEQTATPQS